MDDYDIVSMFWERDEKAIEEARVKYGTYCRCIATNILSNTQDVEEVLNDTFFDAWNAIPPYKPQYLSAFLGKITRNLSLKKFRNMNADKRGRGEVVLSLDELSECVSHKSTTEDEVSLKELSRIIDSFVRTLEKEQRCIFIRRYWYFDSIEQISSRFGYSQSKIKMILLRTREKLRKELEREGVVV